MTAIDDSELHAYGQLATELSREDLVSALAERGIEVVPAARVVRLRINGKRIELEPMRGGFILSRNNEGAAWLAGIRYLAAVLSGMGIRHSFELMNDDVLVERLHHDWPPAGRIGDEQ